MVCAFFFFFGLGLLVGMVYFFFWFGGFVVAICYAT